MRQSSMLLMATLIIVVHAPSQDRPVLPPTSGSQAARIIFTPDPHVAQPAFTPLRPWQILQRMGENERSHATLTIDPGPGAPDAAKVLAEEAASAWNAGQESRASRALFDLCTKVDPASIELYLHWHDAPPVRGNTLFSSNARVGTLDSVTSVALAANLDGSRLYALLAHASSSGSMHLYRSTDKGDSWTETASVTVSGPPPQFAISPLSAHFFVGYFAGAASSVLRVRKFSMETGEAAAFIDGNMTDDVISLVPGDSVREVAAASNIVALNTRMYFAVRTHAKRVRFFWSYPTVDTLWQEIPESSTGGALRGLSASYSYGTLGHRIYLSYVDTSGRVAVDTAGNTGRSFKRVATWPNAGTLTSISAYHDSAICAFDYNGSTAQVRFLATSNGGTTWTLGTPLDTTATNESPAVMMEKGQGTALFYRHYTASSREGRMLVRWYGPGAVWDSSAKVTDYVPHYWRSGIVALGNRTWGILYIVFNGVPALQSVFFTKYVGRPDDVPAGSSMPEAYGLGQNFPNPFNPSTQITYDLPRTSQVRLSVYDLLGKEIARLVDAVQSPGQHAVTWRATGLASGTYFYRLEAGTFTAVKRLVLMR